MPAPLAALGDERSRRPTGRASMATATASPGQRHIVSAYASQPTITKQFPVATSTQQTSRHRLRPETNTVKALSLRSWARLELWLGGAQACAPGHVVLVFVLVLRSIYSNTWFPSKVPYSDVGSPRHGVPWVRR